MRTFIQTFTLVVATAISLIACTPPVSKDPDSYMYSVPVGSTLTLNREITIPANLARRYFQGGKQVNEQDLNIYYPHCSLLMNNLVAHERTIKPARFEIYKVQDDEEYAQRHILYASRISNYGDGPSIVGYASYYFLRSDHATDVRSLECVQWNDPVDVEYVTINEVKRALGDYFTLQLKD